LFEVHDSGVLDSPVERVERFGARLKEGATKAPPRAGAAIGKISIELKMKWSLHQHFSIRVQNSR
jgi:hypothetical protein